MDVMDFWGILGGVVFAMIAIGILITHYICKGLNQELNESRKEILELKERSAKLHQEKIETEQDRVRYWEMSLDDRQKRNQIGSQYKELEAEKKDLEDKKKDLEIKLKESQKRNQDKNAKLKKNKKAQYELEKEILSLEEEISILESEIKVRDGEMRRIYKALENWKHKDDTINALLKEIDEMQIELEKSSIEEMKECHARVMNGRERVRKAHVIVGKTPPPNHITNHARRSITTS